MIFEAAKIDGASKRCVVCGQDAEWLVSLSGGRCPDCCAAGRAAAVDRAPMVPVLAKALLRERMEHDRTRVVLRHPALAAVIEERRRQRAKWGRQNHTLGNWALILMEEVGEWSEAALHAEFGGPKAAGLREEMVQVAAVALQIVEFLDEREGGR